MLLEFRNPTLFELQITRNFGKLKAKISFPVPSKLDYKHKRIKIALEINSVCSHVISNPVGTTLLLIL